jgi:hypothetical protein
MLKSIVYTILLSLSLVAGTGLATEAPAHAQEAKAPVTAADHLQMAKMYQDKAASYRKDAEFHRKMIEEYKSQAASSPKTGPNPWFTKMQKHCQMLIKDAEKLATDAEKSAEFHTLRAKEVEGK